MRNLWRRMCPTSRLKWPTCSLPAPWPFSKCLVWTATATRKAREQLVERHDHVRQLAQRFPSGLRLCPERCPLRLYRDYTATSQEHIYNVVARHPETFFRQVPKPPRRVKFSIDPQALRDCADKDIPSHLLKLPDQQLMAMRAACARVAAMSGAADQLRLIMEDRDDAQTLADSNTTIYLVDSILRTLPVGA